ncbi:MAG: ABC transporter permease [Propioniciclava sp.]
MTTTTRLTAAPAVAAPILHARVPQRRLFTWPLLAGLGGTCILVALSLGVGVYDILGADDGWEMFFITRVPRTIGLVLSGAAMAMAGLVMQRITQNRFVEPTTTGTTEWAGLGLLLTMLVWPESSVLTRMIGAIIAAMIGTAIFFGFLRQVAIRSSLIVPIVGMMFGAVVGAITTYVALASNALQSLTVWFQGSFATVLKGQYEPLYLTAAVVVIIFIAADRFTVAGLGEEMATSVGLNYRNVVMLGTLLIAVVSGVVTVVVGNLPFIGLIVPNLISMFRGDDLRSNLPWVCLTGVALVTVCDLIGRVIIAPFEVPVSFILAVVGAVVFIAMILRQRRRV